MKKLYTFDLTERALAGMFHELLLQEGIECLLRNEQLFSGLGEIPFVECYPELWVVDAEMFPRAQSLLRQYMADAPEKLPEWHCPGCGEQIEGHFNACWNCGCSPSDD
ncbi:MAG: DUF2007 domain-containing protein [Desulfuromonas sp.]|nr:MAG: DUF2007 domain-containing protein [Desulfuromonas sp.]